MKTKQFKPILIIAIVFMALSGCANDQYSIEKRYWHIQRQAEKIFSNPNASPPRELEQIVSLYNSFIKKYPKTNFAVDAQFNIARLYMVKKEYTKARSQLKAISAKYSKSEPICSAAIFMTGNSYEMENKWEAALQEYKKLMEQYPATISGMNVPIYIAQHYKVKYEPDRMIAAFQAAIIHYQGFINKYPKTPAAYKAHTLIVQCYVELKDWESVINTLNLIIDTYKDKINVEGLYMDILTVYNRELKDKAKAKETLARLTRDFPRSKLIKTGELLLKKE